MIQNGSVTKSSFSKKTSATKTNTSTGNAGNRFKSNPNLNSTNTAATKPKQSIFAGKFKYLEREQDKASSSAIPTAAAPTRTIPLGYKWNLPPHNWSLPLRPTSMDPQLVYNRPSSDFHSLRRGRIWFFEMGGNAENIDASGDIKKLTGGASVNTTGDQNLYKTDREWGFQFLWNPESISSQVARNMNITPSSADTLRVVAGAFPSQETFTVSIVLDRVNDFACARGSGLILGSDGSALNTTALTTYQSYYSSGNPPGAYNVSPTFSEKMTALMAQGTMADLEYLFRAINGTFGDKGVVSSEWSNLLGKKTANIGYLQPTLMAFQFGPTLDNLAWVGWISSLGLTHTMFTENMIPLRTEVSIAVEAFTGSGVSST